MKIPPLFSSNFADQSVYLILIAGENKSISAGTVCYKLTDSTRFAPLSNNQVTPAAPPSKAVFHGGMERCLIFVVGAVSPHHEKMDAPIKLAIPSHITRVGAQICAAKQEQDTACNPRTRNRTRSSYRKHTHIHTYKRSV